MKTFTVHGGYTVMVDDEDYERLCGLRRSWSCVANHCAGGRIRYYVQSAGLGSLHRYLLGATSDLCVDHIDGNGLNNTKQNLRVVTTQQNGRNRAKSLSRNGIQSSSQYKGVHKPKRMGKEGLVEGILYVAYIKPDKYQRPEFLGTFKTEALAAYAYDLAASVYFGPHARLNNPDIPAMIAELEKDWDAWRESVQVRAAARLIATII